MWVALQGIYNKFTDRDRAHLERMATMARFFGKGPRSFLQAEGWLPYAPTLHPNDTFASEWPVGEETLWTIVNRGGADLSGPQLSVGNRSTSLKWWDCYHGKPLQPNAAGELSFTIEGRGGLGCVFASPHPQPADFSGFLSKMAALTAAPLSSLSAEWRALNQTMVVEPRTPAPNASVRAGMALIPGAKGWRFRANGTQIESWPPNTPQGKGGDAKFAAGVGVDVQFPFEQTATPLHDAVVDVPSFWIDRTPVTTAEYAEYLRRSGYEPADTHNFLRSWNGSRKAPPGAEKRPVTWVSLAEARAFCSFAGKRLPTTIEWQRAAQGEDGRGWPWGNDASLANGSNCPPLASRVNEAPPPSDVDAYPQGASPFGVMDLVGNVWQYTTEFRDAHTRAVVLRGGSNYYPLVPNEWYKCGTPIAGTIGTTCRRDWYFPNDRFYWPPLQTHGKYFLMSDSWERAGTIGFRCASDAAQ